MPKIVQYTVLFLWNELCLELHPGKVLIATFASGVDFLGWVHFPHERVLRGSTKRRVLRSILGLDTDSAIVQSYVGLLAHGDTNGLFLQISSQSSRKS